MSNFEPARAGNTHVDRRPRADGKFLRAGTERLLVKGVTYGTFAPTAEGHQFPTPERVAEDFTLMAAHGVNTVRTYTLPPQFLLDEAAARGLYVMAGLPWTQHVAFLADQQIRREIEQQIITDVKRVANHPAVLMVALGNEIPPAVVRWHGRTRVEEFLENVYETAKSVAPDTLFTYVNFPPTEFLDLPFFDVASFNVYLHREPDLRAYVTRLQHVAGNRPLLLAELGADSIRQGLDEQAKLTAMQLETAFRAGSCGAIAFAWTDEWWRGGFDVADWDFGLVDRARQPKPALTEVTRVFADAPFSAEERLSWPRVSVVVCGYNAASTIDECLESLAKLTYPNFEVIMVNDGSRDGTGEMARRHAIAKVIDIPNGGLSAARNVGMRAATGEIVAYTDADVRVDPDWLTFLVQPFLHSDVVGSGGPNIVPPDDHWMAQCVARAPGGPTHVLLDDTTAEHVPGCNMAFRRDALLEIDGFNPIYLRAGDDVDVCWRLQAKGWRIGFAPAALVWHRHRSSVKAYWRQQMGYGEGEEWLAPHHPDKFKNGHPVWHGRIYSPLPFVRALSHTKVNSGTWGLAPFPSVYQGDTYPFAFMPHRARWVAGAGLLFAAGIALVSLREAQVGWTMTAVGLAGILITFAKCLAFAFTSDLRMVSPIPGRSKSASRKIYLLTIAWLHFLQPFARARGRLRGILADVEPTLDEPPVTTRPLRPSELFETLTLALGRKVERRYWGDQWTELGPWLSGILKRLRRARVGRNIEVDDGWQSGRDLSVQISRSSWLDLRGLLEDHGSGKRLSRVGIGLRLTWFGWITSGLISAGFIAATMLSILSVWPAVIFASGVAAVFVRWLWMAARTLSATERQIRFASSACGLRQINPDGRVWNGVERRRLPRRQPQGTPAGSAGAR